MLFVILAASRSQAGEHITLGYCNGEIATRSDIEMTGKGWVEAAIRVPKSALKAYVGNEITSIRAALVNRVNIDSLRVWVREDLDGINVCSSLITRDTSPAISKGWNEVSLPTAFAITGEKDIYIGYSFRQKANVAAVSMTGDAMYDISFVRFADGDWTDMGDKGVLGVEAIVEGNNISDYDLGLTDAQISPYPVVSPSALQVEVSVTNYGLKNVEGFSVKCSSGEACCRKDLNVEIPSNKTKAVIFVIDPGEDVALEENWNIEIVGISGAADENMENNSITAKPKYLKNVLVEEFTTEKCINCPAMAMRLNNALDNNEKYAGRISAVCHHSGFYYDNFTQDCDKDFEWFYDGNLYAPGIMIDRSAVYSGKSNTPVFFPDDVQLTEDFDSALATTANAMAGIRLVFNSDSTRVTAEIRCIRNEYYQVANPVLTLYLTEDHIFSVTQKGSEGNYYQEHVIRDYNSSWGEPISWNDNAFEFSWDFALDESWNKKKLGHPTFRVMRQS